VKRSELLQCCGGLSGIIGTFLEEYRQYDVAHYICFRFCLFINVYMVVFLFNTVIYVSSLLYLCILIVILCIFIVPAGTPRQPRMKFFCAYSSVVGQVPG